MCRYGVAFKFVDNGEFGFDNVDSFGFDLVLWRFGREDERILFRPADKQTQVEVTIEIISSMFVR